MGRHAYCQWTDTTGRPVGFILLLSGPLGQIPSYQKQIILPIVLADLLMYSDTHADMPHLIGIVVALHGKETDAGDFWVEDILEAGLPEQIELPLKSGILALSG